MYGKIGSLLGFILVGLFLAEKYLEWSFPESLEIGMILVYLVYIVGFLVWRLVGGYGWNRWNGFVDPNIASKMSRINLGLACVGGVVISLLIFTWFLKN